MHLTIHSIVIVDPLSTITPMLTAWHHLDVCGELRPSALHGLASWDTYVLSELETRCCYCRFLVVLQAVRLLVPHLTQSIAIANHSSTIQRKQHAQREHAQRQTTRQLAARRLPAKCMFIHRVVHLRFCAWRNLSSPRSWGCWHLPRRRFAFFGAKLSRWLDRAFICL